MNLKTVTIVPISLLVFSCAISGCASKAADMLNPFAEEGSQYQGQRSSQALIDEASAGKESDHARHALEVMSDYRRKQDPQPYYPVVQPAEIRLMWVPDHVNKVGDLVPAHYYYLKVLDDRWAVEDAFELEDQLNSGSGRSTAVPWTYQNGR